MFAHCGMQQTTSYHSCLARHWSHGSLHGLSWVCVCPPSCNHGQWVLLWRA